MNKLHLCLYENFLPSLALSTNDLENIHDTALANNTLEFLGWKSNIQQFTSENNNIFLENNKFVSFFTHMTSIRQDTINIQDTINKIKYFTHDIIVNPEVDPKLQHLQKTIAAWLELPKENVRFLYISSNITLLPHKDNEPGLKTPKLLENKNYKFAYDTAANVDLAINFVLRGKKSLFRIITPYGRFDNSINTDGVIMFDPNTYKHATSKNESIRLTFSIRVKGISIDAASELLEKKARAIVYYPIYNNKY